MRKHLIYTVTMILMILSCKAQEIDREAIYGTFYGLDRDKNFSTSYTVELRQDSSFKLAIKVQDANPQCEGKWKIVGNEVLLECDEITDPTKMLSSGYMNKREHKLLIVNKDKLKYDGVVLKRKK